VEIVSTFALAAAAAFAMGVILCESKRALFYGIFCRCKRGESLKTPKNRAFFALSEGPETV
jgi:hypothetical protein